MIRTISTRAVGPVEVGRDEAHEPYLRFGVAFDPRVPIRLAPHEARMIGRALLLAAGDTLDDLDDGDELGPVEGDPLGPA